MRRLFGFGFAIILLGISIPASTYAQTQVIPPDDGGTGTWLNYPSGTRIYQNGAIVVPRAGVIIYPNNTIRHGDGSTTFYYSNGTHINVIENTISPSGTTLVQQTNGGLGDSTFAPLNNPNNTLNYPPNRLNNNLNNTPSYNLNNNLGDAPYNTLNNNRNNNFNTNPSNNFNRPQFQQQNR
jgi:hypothetical protein